MTAEAGAFIGAVAAVLLGLAILAVSAVAVMLIAHAWRKLRDE